MVKTGDLVLHVEASWTSPWVATVFVALREKAIAFSTAISMVRVGAGAADLLYERTLTGTAPVLQHGATWIAESTAIVEYLEELVPAPRLLPAAIADRARARQLMAWLRSDDDQAALRQARPSSTIFYPSRREQLTALPVAAARGARRLVEVARRLGAGASGAVFGSQFGCVDLDLAFALRRLQTEDVDGVEALEPFVSAVWQRPSVNELATHRRPPNPP